MQVRFFIYVSDMEKTIKIEVEITYEYDPNHRNYIDEGYANAVAMDMAINPSHSIEDGVKLLQVCNQEKDYWWLINP